MFVFKSRKNLILTFMKLLIDMLRFSELFQDVRQHLPHSTERDVVLLNVSLEYAAMWIKSPKLMPLLDHSLATVMTLRSNLLRHGMCRMLWSMSLCPIFHDLALLMDKTGRLPKSFTSRKINLPSPDLVIPFLQAAIKLLDASITVIQDHGSYMSLESQLKTCNRLNVCRRPCLLNWKLLHSSAMTTFGPLAKEPLRSWK